MPENAVPENRCGRLGRNDTRGGHRGGAGTPANERERDTLAGPHKSGSAFFVDKSQGGRYARTRAAARTRRRRPRRRRQGPRRGLLRPRTSANEPMPDDGQTWPQTAPQRQRRRPRTRRHARTRRRPAGALQICAAPRAPANETTPAREREASRRRPRRPRERDPPGGASARTRCQAPAGADERGRPRTRSAPWPRAGGGRQILQDDDAGAPPPRRRSYHGRGRRAAQKRGICRNCVGIRRRPRLRARRYILTPTTTPREGNDDGKHQRIQGRAAQVLFPHG